MSPPRILGLHQCERPPRETWLTYRRPEPVGYVPTPDVDAIVAAVGNRLGPWTDTDAAALRDALRDALKAEGL